MTPLDSIDGDVAHKLLEVLRYPARVLGAEDALERGTELPHDGLPEELNRSAPIACRSHEERGGAEALACQDEVS